jgi:glycosyltransferase involved in cell wall biosynthesis
MSDRNNKLRVLLVPDSIYWATGTIAKWIAQYNPWMEATICSGRVVHRLLSLVPELPQRFDLVHFVCSYASMSMLTQFRSHIPVVTTIHHVLSWETEKHNVKGDALMVAARQWRDELVRHGVEPDSMVLVPYGVDCDVFAPLPIDQRQKARRRLGFQDQEFVIGFIAKQSSNDGGRKGIDIFEASAVAVGRQLANSAVLLIGMGWKDLVARLRAQRVKCVWIPFVSQHAELTPVYNSMDCYWVTSRVEGGPVPLLEAMSCGVPCISTPVGLAKEIIDDGRNAFYVPMNDVAAIVARTKDLAASADLRATVGQAAKQAIFQHHRYEVVSRRVPELYELAERRFAERNANGPTADIKAMVRACDVPPQPPVREGESLNGLPVSLHRWVREEEKVNWILWMAQMRQHRQLVMAVAELMPRSLRHWEMWPRFAMAFLPPGMAALIRRLRGTPRVSSATG